MEFRRKFISVLLLVAIFSSLEAVEMPSGGLDANGAAAILGETVGFARNRALKDIEPQIKFGLSGEEFSQILGKGLKSRPEMINTLSKHARKDLGAAEVAAILGETEGFARNKALRSLEPQIKFGLSGDEFSEILGKELKSRSEMINTLSKHAGDQLAVESVQNKAVASTEKSFFSSFLKELPMQLIQAACDGFLLNVCSYFELPVRVGEAVEEWKPVLQDLANPDEPPKTSGGNWFRAKKCDSLKDEEEYWKCMGYDKNDKQ